MRNCDKVIHDLAINNVMFLNNVGKGKYPIFSVACNGIRSAEMSLKTKEHTC